jgi:hypothetical protein
MPYEAKPGDLFLNKERGVCEFITYAGLTGTSFRSETMVVFKTKYAGHFWVITRSEWDDTVNGIIRSDGRDEWNFKLIDADFSKAVNPVKISEPTPEVVEAATQWKAPAPPHETPSMNYINLALINIGEATATIGNLLQRDTPPGSYGTAKLALQRAVAALDGKPYEPPPDVKGA